MWRAITAGEAGWTPENYVLADPGLALERAPVVRPALAPVGGWPGVDEFAGPLQPAWGWESKVRPAVGEEAAGALRDLRMNPYEHTFGMMGDARQAVALAAYGRMDPTSIDLAHPTRGTWLDYLPGTFVDEAQPR